LCYKAKESYHLQGLCDTNYASDQLEWKCTSVGYHFSGGNVISWISKKQGTIVLSITKDENISNAHYCTQLLWMKSIKRLQRPRR